MMPKIFLVVAGILVSLVVLLSVRFTVGRAAVRRINEALAGETLDLPEVDSLEILPVVDFQAIDGLRTEAGLSCLIRADGETALFDLAYNKGAEQRSPLLANLKTLGIDPREIGAIAISHPHVDHAGGLDIFKTHEAWSSAAHADLGIARRFAPVPMKIDGRQATVLSRPGLIVKNIGATGALAGQLFLTGRLYEQALLVNLRGKGLVLVSGCGHPGIVKMVRAAREMTGLPVYAVAGGLHLYYKRCNGGLPPMIVGSDRLFGLPPKLKTVKAAIAALQELGVKKAYVSPHDSDEATLGLFADSFGAGFGRIQAGKAVQF